jgi:molybdopterin molybdotransferase
MALLAIDEALARILKTAVVLPGEDVRLEQALGRVTAKPVLARRDQPPFDASAMDGYALRHEDLGQALKVVGTSAAGHAFKGSLKTGQAVRILTGAPIPKGADTIVIQENVVLKGDALNIVEAPALGRNIRQRGLDFPKGAELVPAARQLNARDIGLVASSNSEFVRVRRNPLVAILTTGDELVLPGQRPRADQITSSNNHALAAFAQSLGAEVLNLGIVPDNLKAITAAIKKASMVDILITTGGASVGDHDFAQAALRKAGVNIDFWKIAMRPGKPFMFGTKGKLRVLGLPGNPVAAYVCATLFLKPLVAAMQGLGPDHSTHRAKLTADLPANDLRQDYLRASLVVADDGSRSVAAAAKQDSSMQRIMRNAQCLIIRKPFAPAAKAGDMVEILLLESSS